MLLGHLCFIYFLQCIDKIFAFADNSNNMYYNMRKKLQNTSCSALLYGKTADVIKAKILKIFLLKTFLRKCT